MVTPNIRSLPILIAVVCGILPLEAREHPAADTQPPIYIAFLWHMHQPIYYPGETVAQTEAAHHFSYSVQQVHADRVGPYTTWPASAVNKLVQAGLSHGGTQVSFSGSLIENLNTLEGNGVSQFANWKASWVSASAATTANGNPRLDLVGFGYFHPLMGLVSGTDIGGHIRLHRAALQSAFGSPASKGFFPPENAFSERMIPVLADAGVEWVLVDNAHFDRACSGFPWSSGGSVVEPNRADVRNPDPADWLQLTGLWMPMKASARWGRQPHWVEYTNPSTGVASKIIAVPADRYLGNEDGRGGFGALQYEAVMSQLESSNTDPNHPILIVLAHDGDNHGGGTDAYYGVNFQSFVAWLVSNPTRFVCTTVQEYLDQYPPNPADVIHVEDGSWLGADAGDPVFHKWNGEPDATGYSPDRNSWAIVTAASNIIRMAEAADSLNPATILAKRYLLMAESSDYWYWDGTEVWDSNPARACNLGVSAAMSVISPAIDHTPPSIFLPQREPYNPGGTEWGVVQPTVTRIWTHVYDFSGLQAVTLRYRTSVNGVIGPGNMTYAGSPDVSAWINRTMADTV